MARIFTGQIFGMLISSIRGFSEKISYINDKYATPKIKMSPRIKFTLMVLRIYLIFLVLLLGYKFWTMITVRS